MVRIPPKFWSFTWFMLGPGLPTRRFGQERLLEWLPTGQENGASVELSAGERWGPAAWGAHSRRDPHHRWRFLRWWMYCITEEEICKVCDGSRCVRRSFTRCGHYVHKGGSQGRCASWQRSHSYLASHDGKEGPLGTGGPRKLGRCHVLADFHQAAITPWPVKALRRMLVWVRWRPGGGQGVHWVENHVQRRGGLEDGEDQVPRRECPLGV